MLIGSAAGNKKVTLDHLAGNSKHRTRKDFKDKLQSVKIHLPDLSCQGSFRSYNNNNNSELIHHTLAPFSHRPQGSLQRQAGLISSISHLGDTKAWRKDVTCRVSGRAGNRR